MSKTEFKKATHTRCRECNDYALHSHPDAVCITCELDELHVSGEYPKQYLALVEFRNAVATGEIHVD